MAVTSPDNLWSPDSTDPYNLTPDLGAMLDTVQDALTNVRTNLFSLGGLDSAKPAAGQEGRTYFSTDTNIEWLDNGTTWVVKWANIRGNVNRSGTATTFPASYTNVSTNTFWTANVAQGITAYNNGWTAPIAGRYLIGLEIRADNSFLCGISVNYSGTSPTLFGVSTQPPVQNVAASTVSFTKKLAAGDVIRPYMLAASGTPAWIPSVGFFSIEWVGAD